MKFTEIEIFNNSIEDLDASTALTNILQRPKSFKCKLLNLVLSYLIK